MVHSVKPGTSCWSCTCSTYKQQMQPTEVLHIALYILYKSYMIMTQRIIAVYVLQ